MLRAGLGQKSFQLEVMSKPRRGPRVISPEYKYLPVWSLPASSSCVLLELLSAPTSIYALMHPPTHPSMYPSVYPSMQCLTASSCLPSVSRLSLILSTYSCIHPSVQVTIHSPVLTHTSIYPFHYSSIDPNFPSPHPPIFMKSLLCTRHFLSFSITGAFLSFYIWSHELATCFKILLSWDCDLVRPQLCLGPLLPPLPVPSWPHCAL